MLISYIRLDHTLYSINYGTSLLTIVCVQTDGWSAVFFAAKSGNLNIVQQLISRGASVELKDKVGNNMNTCADLIWGHNNIIIITIMIIIILWIYLVLMLSFLSPFRVG